MFPEPRTSDALASLVDIVPTFLGLAGDRAARRSASTAQDLGPVLRGEQDEVRDAVLFTYDDHQAATAFQDAPGQPNRIRCVRDKRWKYAVYLDPNGRASPEYELYDLEQDPNEVVNLVDKRTGRGRTEEAERERVRMHALLEELCEETGTVAPQLPPAGYTRTATRPAASRTSAADSARRAPSSGAAIDAGDSSTRRAVAPAPGCR